MDIEKLETFIAVAETGSLRIASEQLFLAPGTVSKHISFLEETFSTSLFLRHPKGVTLTEQGKIFAKYASQIVENYQLLVKTMKYGCEKGIVQLCSIPCHEMLSLLSLTSNFEKDHPNIEINLRDIHGRDITSTLVSGQSEIALCMDKYLDSTLIEYVNLHKSNLILIVSTDDPLAQRDHVSISELQDYKFISLPEKTGIVSTISKMCHQIGFPYKVSYYSERESSIISMVSKNLGIAIIDSSYFHNDFLNYYGHQKVKALTLDDNFSWNLAIAKAKNITLSPAGQIFWNYTLDCAERHIWPHDI